MNVFNRIVTILALGLLLALVVLVALRPIETIQAVQQALGVSSAFLAQLEASYRWLYIGARVLVGVLAALLLVLLLWAELRRRRPKAVKVHTEAGSQATVTTDSVARRLAWHIDQLADVVSVTPQVEAHGKSVNVVLDLETRPEVDVPMKTDEVVGVAREVITERMGMQLGKIQVRIKHTPYQDQP